VCYARYGEAHWMFESPNIANFSDHVSSGLGIFSADRLRDLDRRGRRLYPLCRWFADLKARRTDPWLSYV
jgi:hypothetical protein